MKIEKTKDANIAIQNIFSNLVNFSYKNNRPVWDTVLINVMTLVRNNIEKDVTDATIIDNVKLNIDTLITYLVEYFNVSEPDNPYIVFYLPTYNRIPFLNKRKLNSTTSRIEDIMKKLEKLISKDIEEIVVQNFKIYTIRVGMSKLPHNEIPKYLFKFNHGKIRIMNRRYLLLSHCPLDYHIDRHIRSLDIVESYTGNFKKINQLSVKIFGVPYIPFNKYTHALLGDKVNLNPVVKFKDKQRILDSAVKLRWSLKTESMILTDIKNLNIVPIDLLTNINI